MKPQDPRGCSAELRVETWGSVGGKESPKASLSAWDGIICVVGERASHIISYRSSIYLYSCIHRVSPLEYRYNDEQSKMDQVCQDYKGTVLYRLKRPRICITRRIKHTMT